MCGLQAALLFIPLIPTGRPCVRLFAGFIPDCNGEHYSMSSCAEVPVWEAAGRARTGGSPDRQTVVVMWPPAMSSGLQLPQSTFHFQATAAGPARRGSSDRLGNPS